MKSHSENNVLVVWDQPEDFDTYLVERFPDITFRFASQPDEIIST